jgi:hypothetical protein
VHFPTEEGRGRTCVAVGELGQLGGVEGGLPVQGECRDGAAKLVEAERVVQQAGLDSDGVTASRA